MKEGTRVQYKDHPRFKEQTFVVTKSHGKLVFITSEQTGRKRPANVHELESVCDGKNKN